MEAMNVPDQEEVAHEVQGLVLANAQADAEVAADKGGDEAEMKRGVG
jgi:hypothetical protein